MKITMTSKTNRTIKSLYCPVTNCSVQMYESFGHKPHWHLELPSDSGNPFPTASFPCDEWDIEVTEPLSDGNSCCRQQGVGTNTKNLGYYEYWTEKDTMLESILNLIKREVRTDDERDAMREVYGHIKYAYNWQHVLTEDR